MRTNVTCGSSLCGIGEDNIVCKDNLMHSIASALLKRICLIQLLLKKEAQHMPHWHKSVSYNDFTWRYWCCYHNKWQDVYTIDEDLKDIVKSDTMTISGFFPPVDIPYKQAKPRLCAMVTPAPSDACKELFLYHISSHETNKNGIQIYKAYYPPPLVATITGHFHPVTVYASDYGQLSDEKYFDSMTGYTIRATSYYPNGHLRQQVELDKNSKLHCTVLMDDRGRDCKLPETGSFPFYKAGVAFAEDMIKDPLQRVGESENPGGSALSGHEGSDPTLRVRPSGEDPTALFHDELIENLWGLSAGVQLILRDDEKKLLVIDDENAERIEIDIVPHRYIGPDNQFQIDMNLYSRLTYPNRSPNGEWDFTTSNTEAKWLCRVDDPNCKVMGAVHGSGEVFWAGDSRSFAVQNGSVVYRYVISNDWIELYS